MISSHSKASLFAIVRPCRLRAPSHTRISTVKQQARPQLASLKPSTHRQFSQTSSFAHPRKGSQDKDSIDTEATEYTKSATDDEAARQGDAAFNPDITDPQEMKDVAGKGPEATGTNNALDVSPANPEVSKQRDPTEGGADNSSASSNISSDRKRSSGGSSPSKGSKVA